MAGDATAEILLDPDAHPVLGHRGAAGIAPENTIESFRAAVEQGVDAFEFDTHVTADGVPIVIHDPTLDRTTGGAGRVAALRLEQVQSADAGARFTVDGGRSFPWRGRGLRVPTLAELVATFPDMPLVIELKTARAQHAVKRVLAEHDAARRCILAASDSSALDTFRERPWTLGAATDDVARLRFPFLPARAATGSSYRALFVPVRYYGIPVPTRRFVQAARRAGVPVHVWTVDSPDSARQLWRDGMSGIVSNFPARMRDVRDALFGRPEAGLEAER
ncbi:MAG: glycerophosphodiester phosphodiesterase [Gemmatimonadaceae bacterium]